MSFWGNLSAEEPLGFFGKRDLSYNNLKGPVGYTAKVVYFGITHIAKLHTGSFAAVSAVAVYYNLLLKVGQQSPAVCQYAAERYIHCSFYMSRTVFIAAPYIQKNGVGADISYHFYRLVRQNVFIYSIAFCVFHGKAPFNCIYC